MSIKKSGSAILTEKQIVLLATGGFFRKIIHYKKMEGLTKKS